MVATTAVSHATPVEPRAVPPPCPTPLLAVGVAVEASGLQGVTKEAGKLGRKIGQVDRDSNGGLKGLEQLRTR